ncbi:hypothetical protein EPVG_00044 [Emiliania huxleyi virus 201]|nr:hypothetical protein ELVG_00214 [Emiliania huxleyi virus 203]AEP15590.1 hypothetical protein EQVG_00180 [Emiliania huxleyi virus 207]AEP16024.1 hypothetical protein ERVG_00147 [Emiliania huxleyi virus 208]AET97932.1 hypothetical protein EPVG_00044 [Emiliania huxleyi virus 201]
MNTLRIIVIVESILLVVVAGVLMYLLYRMFMGGQANDDRDDKLTGVEFDLFKDLDGGNEFLLKSLNNHYTTGLKNATQFKGKGTTNPDVSSAGVAFSPFARVFEATDYGSSMYTDTLHNHILTYGKILQNGDTHYPKLADRGSIPFNSRKNILVHDPTIYTEQQDKPMYHADL